MTRVFLSLAAMAFLGLAACTTPGNDGTSFGSGIYKIRNPDKVQFRMLDSVNALRQAGGKAPLKLNAELNAAAATHSKDMALQNRPWHFGSDGSSPLDRVTRTGYTGNVLGETISESYENEVQTLTAWMEDSATRAVLMDAKAVNMGFSWHQEENGKIWWTLITAN